MDWPTFHVSAGVAAAVAIALAAQFSEDAATITAASLAAGSMLDVRLAFFSAFAGLWVGDLGVYALARLGKAQAEKMVWFSRASRAASQESANSGAGWRLALSRLIPGTRLPAYVSAGLNRMPLLRFAGITAATALLWSAAVFKVIWIFPGQAHTAAGRITKFSLVGLALFVSLALWRWQGAKIRARFQNAWQRVARWEFWPAWIFYAPVPAMCAWLSLRYQGVSLPTIANLNQKNGGIIGESKIEILHQLMKTSPDSTATAFLIPTESVEARLAHMDRILQAHCISFPFVLKPDTAQRGAGFRKIRSREDARTYLRQVTQPLVLQRYVEGPCEAGIFYYRFPNEARGRIFGITRKRFPVVTGDGIHSLQALIAGDERARFLQSVYVKRLGAEAQRIPAPGERVRLVEAGNHCQGCIFEDGWDLYTEELRRTIDEISRQVPGFYVGRFDLRYADDDSLRAGKSFQVIELNGAASEATNLYDAKYSLWSAYRTLYRQWRLIYAIGAENRKRGALPRPILDVWRDWRDFSARACEYPIAD